VKTINCIRIIRVALILTMLLFLTGHRADAAPVFTSIEGYASSVDSSVYGIWATDVGLNDFGLVAYRCWSCAGTNERLGTNGIVITDGASGTFVFPPGIFASAYYPGGLSIDNLNDLSFSAFPVNYGLPQTSQLYRTEPPYTSITVQSPPFVGNLYHLGSNSSGQGYAVTDDQTFYRVNGDGTLTQLVLNQAYLLGQDSFRERIVENGDIYASVHNLSSGNTCDIWKFSPGQGTPSVLYSNTTCFDGWDVNNNGDIIVAEAIPVVGGERLRIIPANGQSYVVPGSDTLVGSRYLNAYIADSGNIAAVRNASGNAELLLGQSLTRVLGIGDSLYGGTIVSLSAGQNLPGMNNVGQILIGVELQLQTGAFTDAIVRVDPEGTTPVNPIIPDPCALGGWCFTNVLPYYIVASEAHPISTPPTWFDPDYAQGYEYISETNPFTGVEIPYAYGDGLFELYLYDPSSNAYIDSGSQVVSGEYFDFAKRLGLTSGILRFALRGIEDTAQVDPNNPRGFVTGLTFLNSGATSFSMIPLGTATGPTVTITSPSDGAIYLLNQQVAAGYSCTDSSGVSTCDGPVPSGSNIDTSTVGSKSFTVTATNTLSKTASATNNYSVKYSLNGTCDGEPGHTILQPINSDGSSVFKQGRTVPAKFRVCDANGLSIGTAGVVSSFNLVQVISGTASTSLTDDVVSTTPDTAFRWDSTGQQWIFSISTKSLDADTTYVYNISLNDGSVIAFQFGLK
jgi:hypothetical protein